MVEFAKIGSLFNGELILVSVIYVGRVVRAAVVVHLVDCGATLINSDLGSVNIMLSVGSITRVNVLGIIVYLTCHLFKLYLFTFCSYFETSTTSSIII